MRRFEHRLHATLRVALAIWPAGALPGQAQRLELPARPAGAPGGAAIAREIRTLELTDREERIRAEFLRGNVPSWLRQLVPVERTRRIGGAAHRVTFWVAPDYLAVGSDDDYFLAPLTPQSAQRIADSVGASLPTPLMVDAIWSAARVRLAPSPIPPSPEMTTVLVFEDHDGRVRTQRALESAPAGSLVAGHKKDVVLTPRLDTLRGKVAIYGWHRADGTPIQPLYTGHTDRWVDYSHGIRLVSRGILVDGVRHDIIDVLRDPALAGLLSDDGLMRDPRYPHFSSDTSRVGGPPASAVRSRSSTNRFARHAGGRWPALPRRRVREVRDPALS